MKKSISGRRVPRQVGGDDEESMAETQLSSTPDSTIQRPSFKPRKSTNLRTSFGPAALANEEDEGSRASGVVAPKRGGISKLAIQRNAAKRAIQLPARRSEDEDEDARPSYSVDALRELKDSTPSTPGDFSSAEEASVQDVSQATRDLDLSSKFGSSLARYQAQQTSAIPSASEIAEKKARRARLAKEQEAEEYISLDPDDPGLDNEDDEDENVMTDTNGRLVLKPKDKWSEAESRLIRDDEDVLEDFEDFTEDGKIHLGRKAEQEAERKRKSDMAAQIALVEGHDPDENSDDDDSDTSEKQRNAAFEAAQTRHGTYGAAHNSTPSDPYAHLRPKTPPKISALPTLDGVLERLRRQVGEMQSSRSRKLGEMEALGREEVRLAEEEVRIQRALRETAEKFQALRRERGIVEAGTPSLEAPAGLLLGTGGVSGEDDAVKGRDEHSAGVEEGKDEVGNGEKGEGELEEDYVDEEAGTGHTGLGFAGMSAMPGAEGGMMRPPATEDDW